MASHIEFQGRPQDAGSWEGASCRWTRKMLASRIPMLMLAMAVVVACEGRSFPTSPGPPPPPPVPPPQVFTLTGLIYEPGAGPLAEVVVVARGSAEVRTDASGRFSLPVTEGAVVSFSRTGYLSRSRRFTPNSPGAPVDVELPLQPALTVTVPGATTARLFPDDLEYLTSTEEAFWESNFTHDCAPCKVFDFRPYTSGQAVQVRVSWTAPVELTLSVGRYYEGISAQKTAAAGERELIVQTSSVLERLLIGVASPSGVRQPIPGPVDLNIDVTLR